MHAFGPPPADLYPPSRPPGYTVPRAVPGVPRTEPVQKRIAPLEAAAPAGGQGGSDPAGCALRGVGNSLAAVGGGTAPSTPHTHDLISDEQLCHTKVVLRAAMCLMHDFRG